MSAGLLAVLASSLRTSGASSARVSSQRQNENAAGGIASANARPAMVLPDHSSEVTASAA